MLLYLEKFVFDTSCKAKLSTFRG